jgi:hypothetical protein
MVKVSYYTIDKDGYVELGCYESRERDLFLWQHINAARKQSGASREKFKVLLTSVAPEKKPEWIDPNWPVVLFPKKKSKLAFGRYVYEAPPITDSQTDEEPI